MRKNILLIAMLALFAGLMMMTAGCGVHYTRSSGTTTPEQYDHTSYGVNVGIGSGPAIYNGSHNDDWRYDPYRYRGHYDPYRYDRYDRKHSGPHPWD